MIDQYTWYYRIKYFHRYRWRWKNNLLHHRITGCTSSVQVFIPQSLRTLYDLLLYLPRFKCSAQIPSHSLNQPPPLPPALPTLIQSKYPQIIGYRCGGICLPECEILTYARDRCGIQINSGECSEIEPVLYIILRRYISMYFCAGYKLLQRSTVDPSLRYVRMQQIMNSNKFLLHRLFAVLN